MPVLTFDDLKASGVAGRVNLCSDDPRFMTQTNRLMRWILTHGSFWGTVRRAQFCIDDYCFTTPGCVASVEGIYNGCRAVALKHDWYQFIPDSAAPQNACAQMIFESYGTVPTAHTLVEGGIIRCFVGSLLDIGKTITFYGYDLNKIWVRTLRHGVMQDGETVTLNSPWIDTVTAFGSITATQKDLTLERVSVFTHTTSDSALTPVSVYEYWETRPDYQRYKVPQLCQLGSCCGATPTTGCPRQVIDALVKLEFIEIRRGSDYLSVGNLAAIELGMEALKAKDDGDLARADALFFGNGRNQRLGCIPLLQQELRTMTSDRFTGRVNLFGSASLRRNFIGFR